MDQKPTVGRIVHYKSRGSADGVYPPEARTAIITEVNNDFPEQVRLCVLNPEGMFFTTWLRYGDEPGNWNWLPRV